MSRASHMRIEGAIAAAHRRVVEGGRDALGAPLVLKFDPPLREALLLVAARAHATRSSVVALRRQVDSKHLRTHAAEQPAQGVRLEKGWDAREVADTCRRGVPHARRKSREAAPRLLRERVPAGG